MRKITPKKTDEVGVLDRPKGEKREIYPEIRLPLDALPEAKKWDVGETYCVMIELKMTGISQGRFQSGTEFEVRGIEVCDKPEESKDEKDGEDGGDEE